MISAATSLLKMIPGIPKSHLRIHSQIDKFGPVLGIYPRKAWQMVTLTENAANEIKRELTFVPGAEISVRVGLEAGGCAGTKYVLTPGTERQPNDLETNQFGVTVLVDPITLTSVEGLKIDFVDALMGGGFKFDNPKAARSCGCGESFKPKESGAVNIA
mgnify:CR=1 FL=1